MTTSFRRILEVLNEDKSKTFKYYCDNSVQELLLQHSPEKVLSNMSPELIRSQWFEISDKLRDYLFSSKQWGREQFIALLLTVCEKEMDRDNDNFFEQWFNSFSFFNDNIQRCLNWIVTEKFLKKEGKSFLTFLITKCVEIANKNQETQVILSSLITISYIEFSANPKRCISECIELILESSKSVHDQDFLAKLIFQTMPSFHARHLVISKFIEMKPNTSVHTMKLMFRTRENTLYRNFRTVKIDADWIKSVVFDLKHDLITFTTKEIRSLCSLLKKWFRLNAEFILNDPLYADFIKVLLMQGIFYQVRIDRLCLSSLVFNCCLELKLYFDEICRYLDDDNEFPQVITDIIIHYCNFAVCLHPENSYIMKQRYQKNAINVTPRKKINNSWYNY